MKHTVEYPLYPNGISDALCYIEEKLNGYRLGKRDLMEALLLSEETLLLMQKQAPKNASIKITVSRHIGVPRIKIIVPGLPLPLDDHTGTISLDQISEETESAIRNIMLRSYSDSFKYRNSHNKNILIITTGIPEKILSTYTILAILLAVLTGFFCRIILPSESMEWIVSHIFSPIEGLFISALMCITAPAVFVSLTCSMFRFEGFSELEQNRKHVIAWYILTSALATLIGFFCFHLFKPGSAGILSSLHTSAPSDEFSLMVILTTLIPNNIVEPFINVNSLQLMVTAIVIGTALTMSGKRVRHLKTLFEEADVLCDKVSSLVMRVVPIVVYCSIMNVILNSEIETFRATLELLLTLIAGFFLLLLTYCILLFVIGHLNPLTFLRKYGPTMKNIFFKGSAVAAVPMSLRVCQRQFGIPKHICSFSIPLGSTINMDGNCICLTITSLFFARICGFSLDTNEIVILFFLILILSLGAPIAPGTLILCLVTVMNQLGIDTSVVSLIIGINFILEMLIGMFNSVGDVMVSLIVSKKAGALDLDTYNK